MKMPRIPDSDLGPRPDGQVGRATLPSSDGGASAFGVAADQAAGVADIFAKREAVQQKALQDALDAKQAIVDTVTATRSAGDFEESLRGVSDQLQAQFADTPEKAPAAMLLAARQLADGAINAAPNSTVGLAMAQKTAAATNQTMTSMHSWAQGRMTQKAKNDLTVLENQASRGAEGAASPEQLAAFAADRHADLDPLYDKLSGDSAAKKQELDQSMAKAWVTANSARDPIGTSKALDSTGGFLVDNLSAEDRDRGRKQAEASLEGMGKFKQMQVLKEGVDLTGNAYSLLRTDEWKPGVALSLQQALDRQRVSVTLDPNMKEDARKTQLASLDLQSKTIAALDMVSRRQTGFDPTDPAGEAIRTKLNEDYKSLFKDGATSKDLGAVLQFRHDLAVAASSNLVSKPTFYTLDKAVANSLPKALAKEAQNTWGMAFSFDWRNPRQAGNKILDDYIDPKGGPLGKFTPAESNAAQERYLEQLNDAQDRQQVVDKDTAKRMALDSAYFVKGRHR